jgi:hypothetical protein
LHDSPAGTGPEPSHPRRRTGDCLWIGKARHLVSLTGKTETSRENRAAKNERRRKKQEKASRPPWALSFVSFGYHLLLAAEGRVAILMSLSLYHSTIIRRFSTPACRRKKVEFRRNSHRRTGQARRAKDGGQTAYRRPLFRHGFTRDEHGFPADNRELSTANRANDAKKTRRPSTDFTDWRRFPTENRELATVNCYSAADAVLSRAEG